MVFIFSQTSIGSLEQREQIGGGDVDQSYLGDSYDLVKRFLAGSVSSIAKDYADSFFIPAQIRDAYSKVTGVLIFEPPVQSPFAILLDPCTGIPLDAARDEPTTTHVPIKYIMKVLEEHGPKFLICFDQSFSRGASKDGLMREKIRALGKGGLKVFYYSSHANFLFASKSAEIIDRVKNQLQNSGIPASRLVS